MGIHVLDIREVRSNIPKKGECIFSKIHQHPLAYRYVLLVHFGNSNFYSV